MPVRKKKVARKAAKKPAARRSVRLVPPAIGEYWKGQGGHYAGIMRGRSGVLDGRDYHLIIGGDSKRDLTFDDANKFCAEHDGDGHADFTGMYRAEQSVAFGNVPELFDKAWYWSRELHEQSPSTAWCQDFSYGGQFGWHQDDDFNRARAVRRSPIQ